ncbi:MAG: hypothetical protein JW959_15280 [Pirellulales bacterium]|nr:hypothetical protein [Pirellulales bacterium]
MTVDAESILYSRYGYLGYNEATTGDVTVSGENSKWQNGSTLNVGRYGTGSLNVESGGAVSSGTAYVGYYDTSTGDVTLDGAGSQWTGSGDLYLGRSGDGALNIFNQSTVSFSGTAYLGYNSGSTGAIDFGLNGGSLTAKTLYASNSQLTGTGTLDLRGLVGDLDLTFDEEHELEQSFAIADAPDKNIAVNLDMSDAGNVGDLGAGYLGTGSIGISDEVQVRSAAGCLGYHVGSNGSATVTGEGAQWTVDESLYVGRSGTGTLEVSDGAEMVLNNSFNGQGNGVYSYIGYSAGSTGAMTIDAAAVTGNGGVIVGNSGSGELNITNGGTLGTNEIGSYSGKLSAVGFNAGSVGVATIEGPGSSWTEYSSFYVGYNGSGTLNILNGGHVYCDTGAYIGYNADSTGTVTVNGSNSAWDVKALKVGENGKGDLYVSNGGKVDIYNNLNIGGADESGSSVAVSGIDSAVTCTWIGIGQYGSLNVTDGGVLTASSSCEIIGSATVDGIGSSLSCEGLTMSGALNIRNGAIVRNSGDFNFDLESDAAINFQNGTFNTQTLPLIPERLRGTGTVNANGLVGDFDLVLDEESDLVQTFHLSSGAGLDLTVNLDLSNPNNNGDLSPGYYSNGSLTIRNGVQLRTDGCSVAHESGSTATIVVENSDTFWSVSNLTLCIENNTGHADLSVTDGAYVYAGNAIIGGNGDAHVDGDDSTLSAGQLTVKGNGVVNITNGGYVRSNNYCTISSGSYYGSGGAVTVDGEGSTFECRDDLHLGGIAEFGGYGRLNILNGGNVTVLETTIIGWHNDTNSYVVFDNGSLTTQTLYTSPSQATGTGVINLGGIVSDIDLVFDQNHGTSHSFMLSDNITVNIDSNSLADLGAGYMDHGTLTIRDGIAVTSNIGYLGYYEGSSGAATITGAGSSWIAKELYVGRYGSGTLNITDGGHVNVNAVMFSSMYTYINNQGHVAVSGEGSNFYTSYLYVNDGSIAVTDKGTGASGNSYIGQGIDNPATITVSGSGSSWNFFYIDKKGIRIGSSSTGILNVINGGSVTSSAYCFIGYRDDVCGYATVDGDGSNWSCLRNLTVGYNGRGILKVTDGGTLSTSSGDIGYGASSIGNVATVSGDGSSWTIEDALNVGYGGAGTLVVNRGGVVASGSAYIGYNAGSSGEAVVSGEGSAWNNTDAFYVGYSGNAASLNVEQGGAVSSGSAFLGYNSGSAGEAIVSGEDSAWNVAGALYVGRYGNGNLRVLDGAAFTSGSGIIGYGSSSVGSFVIDGVGSVYSTVGDLTIGYYGKGILSLSGGAAASAASASINTKSLLAIDVGRGSSFTLTDEENTFTNEGTVRIFAGADATAGNVYAPISAETWEGEGVYQAVGGTWDGENHLFTVSSVASGNSGEQLSLDLAATQRALIVNGGGEHAGWSLGMSFLAKTGDDADLLLTAAACDGDTLADLTELIEPSQIIKGAWQITLGGDGYSEDDSVYLSFAVGEGFDRVDLVVWHYDGESWTAFDATDLTYNSGWVSFTASDFSGYAVAVPEPGTLALAVASGIILLLARRRKFVRRCSSCCVLHG